MTMDDHDDDALDPELQRVLSDALRAGMDVEVAARHLWRMREVAERLAATRDTAATATPGTPATRAAAPAGGALRRQRAAALLSAVFLFAMSGVAIAGSGHALPGELLYPVKRGTEHIQLLTTWDATADAELNLRFARLRLAEATSVATYRPAWGPRLVADAVRAVDRAEERGGAAVAQEAAQVREEAGQTLLALGSGTPDAIGDVAQAVEPGMETPEPVQAEPPEEDASDKPSDREVSSRESAAVPPPRGADRLFGTPSPDRADVPVPTGPEDEPDGADDDASSEAPDGNPSPDEEDATPPASEPVETAAADPAQADTADEGTADAPGEDADAEEEDQQPTAKRVPSSTELAARFDAREDGSGG